MSEENRVGKVIRQAYGAFWKEWVILAISAVLIFMPEAVVALVNAQAGPEALGEFPVESALRYAGLLGALYAVVYKIGYDLLANRYILDQEQVVEIYGIIQKNRRVTKLEHIRRVSVEIGFVGRILGYGDVLYYTAGSGGVDVRLKDIPNPEALAAEADELAKQHQAEMSEAGEAPGPVQGGGAAAAPSAQILDAFSESVTESVSVQREILAAIKELRTETRRNTSALKSMLGDRSASAAESATASTIDQGEAESRYGEPDLESSASTSSASDPHSGEPASTEIVDEDLYGDEEEFTLDENDAEPDPYASSPKMFGDWEDALSSGGSDEEAEDVAEPVKPGMSPEPESIPNEETEEKTEEGSSNPDAADDEFVGLMSPKRK